MKAVFLAAGKGTRMGELTKGTPKALLKKGGITLLEHGFEVVPPGTSEIIVVIEYLGESIRRAFGNEWRGIPIRYVEQGEKKGTAGALWQAREFLISEEFLILPCDDIYSASDMSELAKQAPCMLVSKVTDRVCAGGNIQVDEKMNLLSINEGVHHPPCLIATGAYFLNDKIFDFPLVQISGRDEYGLPQTLIAYSKEHSVGIVEATSWVQVVTADDLK